MKIRKMHMLFIPSSQLSLGLFCFRRFRSLLSSLLGRLLITVGSSLSSRKSLDGLSFLIGSLLCGRRRILEIGHVEIVTQLLKLGSLLGTLGLLL